MPTPKELDIETIIKRIRKRPGRENFYGYFSNEKPYVSLGTVDLETAIANYRKLLASFQPKTEEKQDIKIADIFAECVDKAENSGNFKQKTAYDRLLNLRTVSAFLQAADIVYLSQIDKRLVERYKQVRLNPADNIDFVMEMHKKRVELRRGEKEIKQPSDKKDPLKAVGAARINRELNDWKQALKPYKSAAELDGGSIKEPLPGLFQKLKEKDPVSNDIGLTLAEVDRWFAQLRLSKYAKYEPLFRVVLGTGMRDEEMRHMSINDIGETSVKVSSKPVDFCDCCINGWTSKNWQNRSIPASPATINFCKAFIEVKSVLQMDKKKVWCIIQEICQEAKIAAFSLHELRKVWASHMLAAKYRLIDISKWLGHKDIITTMRYLKTTEEPDLSRLPF